MITVMAGVLVCSILIMVGEKGHLMMVLLALELASVSAYVIAGSCLVHSTLCAGFSIVVLVFSVCEAALGLGLLVAMVRGFGGEYVPSVFIMKI